MSRLMVPVQLEVLMVRQDGGRFADCTMRAPREDGESHRDLWQPPFSERPEGRTRGAYLHWALPDALTRGTVNEDGSTSFFAIPDRWLVVRTWPSPGGGAPATRSWVLEADRGEVFPAATWSETARPAAGREPLTALGHGDVAWAAYFDTTENRLAFHDELAEVAAGPIAYLVSGWYSAAERDPIADPGLDTRVAVHERLDELRWRIAGPSTPRAPTGALFHGGAVGLAWPAADPASPESGGAPPASATRVVLASTTAEALATLIARSPAEVRMLEASQMGLLDEIAEPDGRTRLDAVLHAAAFSSSPGGEVLERVVQPEPPPPPQPPMVRTAPAASRVAAARAPEMAARRFVAADRARETVAVGSLGELVAELPAAEDPPPPPAGPVDVYRTLPRFFAPADPIVLIEGARRSFRHGGDGRFSDERVLACRLAGDTVTELSVFDPRRPGERLAVRGRALLEPAVTNRAIPEECEALVRELVLLDPGASRSLARAALGRAAEGELGAAIARRVEVEQTAWWATRRRGVDAAGLLTHSGITGTLPSPLAVTPARRPWSPVHLEWEAEYTPSPGGVADWRLGELDFEPVELSREAPIRFAGRTLITPAAPHIASRAARRIVRQALRIGSAAPLEPGAVARFASEVSAALDAHIGSLVVAGDDGELDLESALADMDVLSGSLDPLHEQLRATAGLRAGSLVITRLRLVDGFGQLVDLIGGAASTSLTIGETLAIEGEPARAALAPRLTSPARLWLRYTEAGGGEALASPETSPVAGYLVPNHLEGALEIFDAGGTSRAIMRPASDGTVRFEASPGIAATVAARPGDALENPALIGLAEELLDWSIADATTGRSEGALAALLRLIDASRWSADPQGHGVEDSLGALIGRPVAVLAAHAWIELEPEAPEAPADLALPMRLGALASFQDGLHGAFVGGDYRALLAAGAAARMAREVGRGRGYLQPAPLIAGFHERFANDVASLAGGDSPITHPYVVRDRPIMLGPGRRVPLTLLVEPYGLVHATTGVLPRKDIGMRREWLAGGLARIAPTFRFGPVLVDPARVRLPVAREAAGTWSWAHRVDETEWAEEPVLEAAGRSAPVGATIVASEGWLRFTPEDPSS